MSRILEIAKEIATTSESCTEEERLWEESLEPSKMVIDNTRALLVQEAFNKEGIKIKNMKATPTAFIHNMLHLNGQKFDFTGREYLLPIYNSGHQKILLKTSRQVEKCVALSTEVTLADGSVRQASELKVGDKVLALTDRWTFMPKAITAIESNGVKPLLCITTKKHRTVTVTQNHPFRTILGWVNAEDLNVGDFIALPHRAGTFGEVHKPEEASILGYMLSEGYFEKDLRAIHFHQVEGECLTDFINTAKSLGNDCEAISFPSRPDSKRVTFYKTSRVYKMCYPYHAGKKSKDIEIPEWLWGADAVTTRAFIQSAWAGDGHCKEVRKGKIDLNYSSTSKKFMYGLQRLLLKFGIFSTIRENTPTLYKGSEKRAYILRILGERSIQRFYNDIGPIVGKPFSLDGVCGKDQSDIIPKGVCDLFLWMNINPYYNFQRNKFLNYCESLNRPELWDIYNADIYWDPIVSVESVTGEETLSIEVEGLHNFITGGIVTHNTTLLANNLVINSVTRPFFKSLYVSPSHMQTRQFSNEKLKPVMEQSPLIAKYLLNHNVSSQVFEKGFANGSMIFLRSCFLTADRSRGISSDEVALDEIQDFLISNIPVILECLSHSKYKFQIFAGTPKTFENTIEQYWENSSQGEWMVPCDCKSGGTGKFWNFLDDKNISKTKGVVCKNCGKRLDVSMGKWVIANKDSNLMGFRIPQLMVPWIINTPRDWEVLINKFETYPTAQFNNEVLGLSYDHSSKPISQTELQACCTSEPMWASATCTEAVAASRKFMLFGGVDWGEGRDGGKTPGGKVAVASYTILTIAGYVGKVFRVFYVKKYTGKEIDPDYIVRDITSIAHALNLRVVGVDYGHGWGVNNALIRMLTLKRVILFQHVNMKERRKWDERGAKFELNRNLIMSELFLLMKAQLVSFPRWDDYKPIAKDIMAIYAEYCEYARTIKFDHKPSEPDDAFHSMLYAWQAANIHLGRSD